MGENNEIGPYQSFLSFSLTSGVVLPEFQMLFSADYCLPWNVESRIHSKVLVPIRM